MLKNKIKNNKYLYPIVFYLFRFMPLQIKFFGGFLLRMLNITAKYNYKELKKFHNIHMGKRCFVVATGPSLKLEDLQLIKNEYSFSMNSIVLSYKDTDWRPTYYAIQDCRGYNKLKESIKNANMKYIFCGISNKRFTPDMDVDYIPFPLNLLDHGKATSNHMNKFSDDCYKVVYDGHSITYSVIQLAVYMGFKEIYLLGVDCNYANKGKDHIVEYIRQEVPDAAFLMQESYKVAKKYADNHGIKIYNASRGGSLEVFEKVTLEEVLAGK